MVSIWPPFPRLPVYLLILLFSPAKGVKLFFIPALIQLYELRRIDHRSDTGKRSLATSPKTMSCTSAISIHIRISREVPPKGHLKKICLAKDKPSLTGSMFRTYIGIRP
ncbi:unnamed protein product [Lathyrus sativus]|nr:unnamed protein product [Lathyrus sativus]